MTCIRTAPAAGCLLVAFAATVVSGQSQPAPAPTPAPAPAPVWSIGEIRFSGLIDGYYSFNANHPASRGNLYRNFDVKANQMTLNMARLALEHDADPVGFRLDLGFGRAWDVFNATEPGPEGLRHIPQAYISLKPTNMKGTQFDFGKFYTAAGAELTENHQAWNYSRSLIYANGPYYHFGLRVTQPVNDSLTVGFHLVNGWNNVEDNNSGKTVGFTTGFTKKKFAWFNSYYTGPEKTGTNEGFRNFYDGVLLLTPNDKVNAYINFDYGREKQLGAGSNDIIAVAGAVKFQLTPQIALIPRLEMYYDKDGWITGTAQKLKEFTLTGEYKWAEGLLSRIEYRRDWSDQRVFERGSTPNAWKNQDTFLIGFVAVFGPKR
jgi:hypothetical protein